MAHELINTTLQNCTFLRLLGHCIVTTQIMLLAIIPGGQELYANHPVVAICCQTGDTLLKFKIPWTCSAAEHYPQYFYTSYDSYLPT